MSKPAAVLTDVIAFPQIGHNKLEYIKRRIIEGHERATKGGAEWVEGSLQVAAALREGRDTVPANIAFSAWLKQNGLAFYSKEARGALIALAEDNALARVILTETPSRSYELIWRANKSRYRSPPKTPPKKRARVSGRAAIFRAMKLGDEVMAKIRGTSLDSAAEMDELIMLNRGAPEGDHTAIVKRIVEDAAAGKEVSAIAEGRKNSPGKASSRDLAASWQKRMVAAWKLAQPEQRVALLLRLSTELNHEHQEKLIEGIMSTWER